MITLNEVKQYSRIDVEDDDELLKTMIVAAEKYLKNATGKEYPETDEQGIQMDYSLEKIYLQLLITHWYEQRSPIGKVGEGFSYSTKSLMLQLQTS